MESYPGLSNFFVVSVNTTPLLSPRSPELTVFSGRTWVLFCCCSVTKSCPTLCVTHGLQHARLPCPSLSPSPGVCSNSCTLSQWCHPTISSSVIPFSCLQSFPASGSFLVSQLFASRGQSIGASASAPFLPMNIQGWLPLGLTGLISLLSKEHSRVFSSTAVWKHQFFGTQPSSQSNFHIHIWLLENHSFDYTALCRQSNISAFKYAMFVIAFLPRSKHLLISRLQSLSAVILEPKKIKSVTVSHCFLFAMKWWDECHDLHFLSVEF